MLAIILSASLDTLRSESETTRSLAGLILKNNIRQYFLPMNPQVMMQRLHFIKSEVIKAVSDPSQLIRATGSIVVTRDVNSHCDFRILRMRCDAMRQIRIRIAFALGF